MSVKYSEIRDKLQTGDLFLFRGETLLSKETEILLHSRVSHVAMVVRDEHFQRPLIWQATDRVGAEDVHEHKHHGGAQLNFLRDAMWTYDEPETTGRFAWRKLNTERGPEFEKTVQDFIEKVIGTPFPSGWKMISDWVKGWVDIKQDGTTYFCAALVSETLMNLGLLGDHPPPNDYTPKKFTDRVELDWLKGATLEPEVFVDLDI